MPSVTLYYCEHCGRFFRDSGEINNYTFNYGSRVQKTTDLCENCFDDLIDNWFNKKLNVSVHNTCDGTSASVFTY